MTKISLAALAFALPAAPAPAQEPQPADQSAWTQACADWDEWDRPGPPFHVFGNTWYVGTCGIGAILVTNERGHVLIDSGTEAGAEIVLANMRTLGFDPEEVALLLQSHEHHDHVGGMAAIQEATGAPLMVAPAAREAMRTGKVDSSDPQAAISEPMAPVSDVSAFLPGAMVMAGPMPSTGPFSGLALMPILTPGHTPGATSWQWQSCEGDVCKSIVYADSLSPVSADDYRFSDHPDYLAAYRESLDKVAALDCDILLTPHPSASGMRDKLVAGDLGAAPTCKDYAEGIGQRLDARIAEEAGK